MQYNFSGDNWKLNQPAQPLIMQVKHSLENLYSILLNKICKAVHSINCTLTVLGSGFLIFLKVT